jgi:hypothetical protein
MSERPWFKFYPGDWRSESALRMVSMGARALWVEMLCIMHESDPRGYLVVRDKPLPMDRLAILAGCTLDEACHLMAELVEAEVCSQTHLGVIFSRKMVRESRISEEQRLRVEKRWGRNNTEKKEEIRSGITDNNTETVPISKLPEPELNPERISDANASSGVSASPTPADCVKVAFDEWNDLARRLQLPAARKLDPGRRKAIRGRLADGGLDAWREALAAVEHSVHCRGQNDRNWRADLDFVCQPKSWRRLLEGSYGDTRAADGTVVQLRAQGPPSITDRIAEENAEARRRAFARMDAEHG